MFDDIEIFSEEEYQLAMAVLMLKVNNEFVKARRVQEKLHNLLSTPTLLVCYSDCVGKFTMITN
jgi:hypothetical protein